MESHIDGKEDIHVVLKKMKSVLKDWDKKGKNELEVKIQDLQEKLDDFDQNNISGEEVKKCRMKLEGYLKKQNSMLQQKARINWIQKGDRNNKFFNKVI